MLRAIVGVCALLGATACGGPSDGSELDGGPRADASPGDADAPVGGGGGLTFEFRTAPVLPTVTADLSVDEIRLELRDVRAIGDSAPGDSRTSRSRLTLEWKLEAEPAPLVFDLAPPGIYSNFEARLGAATTEEERFEIRGKVRVSGELRDFRIQNDRVTRPIAVALGGLTVGAVPRVATLSLSLAFLSSVPWSDGAGEEDELQIDDDDPRMPAIEAALVGALTLTGVR